LCVALATCMITTMGIKAADIDIDLSGTQLEITKHMLSDPRRIGKIEIILMMPEHLSLKESDRLFLQKTGDNCPVMKSLHPDLLVEAHYRW